MLRELININDTATLEVLVGFSGDCTNIDRTPRPLVLIVPGGSYSMLSYGEGDPIALGFLNEGFAAAVLRYSVAPARFPKALTELAKAVCHIRENCEKYSVDPDMIYVCGFSAGGHLAGSFATLWNRDFLEREVGTSRASYKPNGSILCYPVLANHGAHHKNSFENLLGDGYGKSELMELTSLEKQVSKDTPRSFLMHTYEDEVVPIEGTLKYAEALRACGVPFELHIYEPGAHGVGNASGSRLSQWIKTASDWIKQKR